jgi:hypothetical protein
MYFPGENYTDMYIRNKETKQFVEQFVAFFHEQKEIIQNTTNKDEMAKRIQPDMGEAGEWLIHLDYNAIKVLFFNSCINILEYCC